MRPRRVLKVGPRPPRKTKSAKHYPIELTESPSPARPQDTRNPPRTESPRAPPQRTLARSNHAPPNRTGQEPAAMSAPPRSPVAAECPPTGQDLQRQARERMEEIIPAGSSHQGPVAVLEFAAARTGLLRTPGCVLIQLFRRAHLDRL